MNAHGSRQHRRWSRRALGEAIAVAGFGVVVAMTLALGSAETERAAQEPAPPAAQTAPGVVGQVSDRPGPGRSESELPIELL